MARIEREDLRRLALEAVEEAAAASHHGLVPRTRGLALALAWLLHSGKDGDPPPRRPLESFWEGLTCEREHDRWSAVNAATNAFYRALDVPRDRAHLSLREAIAPGELMSDLDPLRTSGLGLTQRLWRARH